MAKKQTKRQQRENMFRKELFKNYDNLKKEEQEQVDDFLKDLAGLF